jgi:hypothetical protein
MVGIAAILYQNGSLSVRIASTMGAASLKVGILKVALSPPAERWLRKNATKAISSARVHLALSVFDFSVPGTVAVLDVVFFYFAMSRQVGQVWEEGKESKRKIDLPCNQQNMFTQRHIRSQFTGPCRPCDEIMDY